MGEHVLELAMYLDMLNSNCFPSWPHVFVMAEEVMNVGSRSPRNTQLVWLSKAGLAHGPRRI